MSRLSDFLFGLEGGGGIGGMPIQIVSSDTLLSPNFSYGIDTSQGVVEVTLPASPIPGDRISFFDAALTWNKNPATVHVNGNQVEQETVALTSYLLNKKAGIQELLFISHLVGWKDISLYKTAVHPSWYGSYLSNSYSVHEFNSIKNVPCTKVGTFTTSGEYEASESGWYCVLLAGGSGGGGHSTASGLSWGDSAGGDSLLKIDGLLHLRDWGGGVGVPRLSNENIKDKYRVHEEVRSDVLDPVEILTLNPNGSCGLRTRKGTFTLWDHSPSEWLGIPSLKVSARADAGGRGVKGSSILLKVASGSILSIEVGERGLGSNSSYHGHPGKGEIYFLGDAPWYLKS